MSLLQDPELPAARVLLAPAGDAVIESWIRERGGTLLALERRQVLYRPARSVAVSFDATVEWPGEASRRELVVAAARADGELPPGAASVARDGIVAGLWRYPDDPLLPGLAAAADPAFAAGLCEQVGLDCDELDLRPVAYRPLRRAVVRLTARRKRLVFDPAAGRLADAPGGARLYLKVLRPDRIAEVRARLQALRAELPVPACLFAAEDLGVLVLEGLSGDTLGRRLRGADGPLPSASELLELLDRLAKVELDAPRVQTATQKARRQAQLLRAVMPDHARRIDAFVRALGEDEPAPLVTTHGDFYESQLLVDRAGAVVGVLDVDGAGPGQQIDDLASMLGRVWATARDAPRRERGERYTEELFEAFAARCDARELCRRVAAVVFGRATGPFRNQKSDWAAASVARIEQAERWLRSAPSGEPAR